MRRAGLLLFAGAGLFGCHESTTLLPPERPAAGSAFFLGLDTEGQSFVLADDGQASLSYPAVKLREGLQLWDVRLACELEQIGELRPGLQTLSEVMPGRALIPAPDAMKASSVNAKLEQSPWSEALALPDEAQQLLTRLPLPPDNACRLATTSFETELKLLTSVDVPNDILVPTFAFELGDDDFLFGHEHSEDVVGGSTTSFSVHRVRGDDATTASTGPTLGYLASANMGGEHYLFGRRGLTHVEHTATTVSFPTITSSTPFPALYNAAMTGSNEGEAPELFLVTSAYRLVGNRPAEEQFRTFRHFDGVTRQWDIVLRLPARARPMNHLSLARIGPGQAIAIGLEGEDEVLFWLHDGTLDRLEQPGNLRGTAGPPSIVRHLPLFGTVVVTDKAAIYAIDLQRNDWKLIKLPADDPDDDVALDQITQLFETPEGFMAVGERVRAERGDYYYVFAKGVGACGVEVLSERSYKVSGKMRGGGHVLLEYNSTVDTIRYRVLMPKTFPLPCAQR